MVGGIVLFFALHVPQGISAWKAKNQEIGIRQRENAALAKEVSDMNDRIQKLRTSRAAQERAVRERLKLQRQGETAIITGPQH